MIPTISFNQYFQAPANLKAKIKKHLPVRNMRSWAGLFSSCSFVRTEADVQAAWRFPPHSVPWLFLAVFRVGGSISPSNSSDTNLLVAFYPRTRFTPYSLVSTARFGSVKSSETNLLSGGLQVKRLAENLRTGFSRFNRSFWIIPTPFASRTKSQSSWLVLLREIADAPEGFFPHLCRIPKNHTCHTRRAVFFRLGTLAGVTATETRALATVGVLN